MHGLSEDTPLVASRLPEGVQIRGVRGSWRWFNPVVRLESVTLPDGVLTGVRVELDTLESLVRRAPVFRDLRVADGWIGVRALPDGGLQFAGLPPGDRDWSTTLTHSDQISVSARLEVGGESDQRQQVRAELQGQNRLGAHSIRGRLRDTEGGAFTFGYDESVDGAARGTFAAQDFKLEPGGLSSLGLELLAARVDISGDSDAMHVSGTIAKARVTRPAKVPVDVAFAVSGNVGDGIALLARNLQFDAGSTSFTLPVVTVRRDAAVTWVAAQTLDVADATEFLGAARLDPQLSDWLNGLDPAGQLRNVRAFLRHADGLPGYAADFESLNISPYKGVPHLVGGKGSLYGTIDQIAVRVLGTDAYIAFPDVFDSGWQLAAIDAHLEGWFDAGSFGLTGQQLDLSLALPQGASAAQGAFGLSREPDPASQHLFIRAAVDRVGIADAKLFAPHRLNEALLNWLKTAPQGGEARSVGFAYQGAVVTSPNDFSRRAELVSRADGVSVQYHPDWPPVDQVNATFHVAGQRVHADVSSGRTLDIRFEDAVVDVDDSAKRITVDFDTQVPGSAALHYVVNSPLHQQLPFVSADWSAVGNLQMQGRLLVPLEADVSGESVHVDMHFSTAALDLAMPEYRIELAAMSGEGSFRSPHWLASDTLSAQLFERPAQMRVVPTPDAIAIEIRGRGDHVDLFEVLDVADIGLASGEFDFAAELVLPVASGTSSSASEPHMTVRSNLVGLGLDFPGELRKRADVPRNTLAVVHFNETHNFLDLRSGPLHVELAVDDVLTSGAIGVYRDAPAWRRGSGDILIVGSLDRFELSNWIGGADSAPMPAPFRFQDFVIREFSISEVVFPDSRINGTFAGPDAFDLAVLGDNLDGDASVTPDTLMAVDLAHIRVPAAPEPPPGEAAEDPFSVEMIELLPAATVNIDKIYVDEDDFGSWRFRIMPLPEGVRFGGLEARFRDLHIASEAGVFWHGGTNHSSFSGAVVATNLADVLPHWGYAPSVVTKSATLAGQLVWPGSPVNVDMLRLVGNAEVNAEEGYFAEAAQGNNATKIFSLLNFSAITRRINFDFSDVTGKGVSFEHLEAAFSLDEGLLRFTRPMEVHGTGSKMRLHGDVNLNDESLHNEMILTLPVSSGLPWYATYVALANPIAGLSVLLGERVLRKPLEQFSSAKYSVTGTLEDPQVELLSVFDNKMSEVPPVSGSETPVSGDDPEPGETDTGISADEGVDTRESLEGAEDSTAQQSEEDALQLSRAAE